MTAFERKRLAAGLTQKKLADKLDLHPSAVSQWERGKSTPEAQYFPKLAKIFGITSEAVTHLFDEQPATLPSPS